MKSIKLGTYSGLFVAFMIGLSLIEKDSSPHFFTLYFTIALPISLTVGVLVTCIAEIFKRRQSNPKESGKESE